MNNILPRPNGIMFVKAVKGKKHCFVYVRDIADHYWGPYEQEYVPTTDPTNMDPFVNWTDIIPGREWVYPVIAKQDKTGWMFRAYDTYNEVMWNNKSETLVYLDAAGVIFKFFSSVLDAYKNMNDDQLLEELNVGRIDKWTFTELASL